MITTYYQILTAISQLQLLSGDSMIGRGTQIISAEDAPIIIEPMVLDPIPGDEGGVD